MVYRVGLTKLMSFFPAVFIKPEVTVKINGSENALSFNAGEKAPYDESFGINLVERLIEKHPELLDEKTLEKGFVVSVDLSLTKEVAEKD
jgi:hypothetical protein